MVLNILSICVGTAIACLSLWSAVQARNHTTPKGRPPTGYNASASAVCATWLVFQTFLVNALRSKLPQLQFPVILYAIFANIALVYGVQFPNTHTALTFAKTLLIAFLSGFGIATATHFIVVPINARMPVFGALTSMVEGMRGVLKAHSAFMQAYEDEQLITSHLSSSEDSEEDAAEHKEQLRTKGLFHHRVKDESGSTNPIISKEEALTASTQGLVALLAKLEADVPFAKRETAFGKLNSQDISDMVRKLRETTLPLLGLGSLIDITHNYSKLNGWDKLFDSNKTAWEALSEEERKSSEIALEEWQKVMKTMHEPFSQITAAMDGAMEHVLLVLELKKAPKSSKKSKNSNDPDIEAPADPNAPGETDFAKELERKIEEFYESRSITLHTWCAQRGIHLPPNSFDPGEKEPWADMTSQSDRRHRGQLYIILYMEYLLYAASKGTLDLVRWADGKVADGTMKKNRLIAPSFKRIRKWANQMFTQPDHSDVQAQMNSEVDTSIQVSVGDAFTKHDPEHLPLTTAWERATDWIRLIPHMFRSEHCAHGLRAAAATMSIGIIAYLHSTQTFFIQNRLVWAMIMIAFSMQRTSGQAAFQFGMRIAGTALGMVASYVVWYVVDGHTAGVIVFLFLWLLASFWIVFNKPRYAIIGVLAGITSILIVGYELQVQKIGKKLSESNGQPAYPTYTLAPYRLATVVGGLFVAYFWTIFPYPVTEHSELRRDVSSALYLIAQYYSAIHETVLARTHGREGNTSQKTSPGYMLMKVRQKQFTHVQRILNQIREVSSYTNWQIFLGGRFPREKYTAISSHLERIIRCIALMGFTSTAFDTTHGPNRDTNSEAEWLSDFRDLVKRMDPTSHAVTNRLSQLSNCLSNGHPLPPYMPRFEQFHLITRISSMDRDILSVRHLAEPGYAAFAVMSIASRQLVEDLNDITDLVRELVGEMDFSLKTVPPNAKLAGKSD